MASTFAQFLSERAPEHGLPASPAGVCLLPGRVAVNNLKSSLVKRNIPATDIARYTTIEQFAKEILRGDSRSANILNRQLRSRMMEQILEDADDQAALDACSDEEAESIRKFAEKLAYREESTLESLDTDLIEYLRMTDASRLTTNVEKIPARVPDEYSSAKSRRALRAFSGLTSEIQQLMNEHDLTAHLSRSHLVRSACEVVNSGETELFEPLNWIAVTGISVIDFPTTRLLELIAAGPDSPGVHVFQNRGSREYNAHRFDRLVLGNIRSHLIQDGGLDSDTAEALLQSAYQNPTNAPDATLRSFPRKRRAIQWVAAQVNRLLAEDVPASRILIVAPDAGRHESLFKQESDSAGVPIFIETRQPHADLPAYRCIQGLLEAIKAIAENEDRRISRQALLKPLRLGYCKPEGDSARWPLSGEDICQFDSHFAKREAAINDGNNRILDRSMELEVYDLVSAYASDTEADWAALREYMRTLANFAEAPPQDGDALRSMLDATLKMVSYGLVEQKRLASELPGTPTSRTRHTDQHLSSGVQSLRDCLPAVKSYYDHLREVCEAPASWEEAERALAATAGSSSEGSEHQEAQAVPIVDAGNAFFRSGKKHVIMMGMNEGEFPSRGGSGSQLPEDFRRALYQQTRTGELVHEHLDGPTVSENRALDFYEAALGVADADADITLVHTRTDDDGRRRKWSPFVGDQIIAKESKRPDVGETRVPDGDPFELGLAGQSSGQPALELANSRSERELRHIVISEVSGQQAEAAKQLSTKQLLEILEQLEIDVEVSDLRGPLE